VHVNVVFKWPEIHLTVHSLCPESEHFSYLWTFFLKDAIGYIHNFLLILQAI